LLLSEAHVGVPLIRAVLLLANARLLDPLGLEALRLDSTRLELL